MRYSLRTVLILTLLCPPVTAAIVLEAKGLGLAILLIEAVALGIAGATLAFCFSFLFGPR